MSLRSSAQPGLPKHQPLWQQSVTYSAVGATQSADLLARAPEGFRPIVRRSRIGHGDLRWEYAVSGVMTWAVQRNSGMRVEVADAPTEVTDQTYVPVGLGDDGHPAPASIVAEKLFGTDGTAFIVPGDSIVLKIGVGPLRLSAPARVVYVIDEPRRKGFAYGTLPGHPERGEEAFIVEHTSDGSVWIEISAFSRPSSLFWWLGYPVARVMQAVFTRRYLRALAGTMGTTSV